MRRKKIGQKYFSGTVNVTDPCYDKDEVYRMDVNVKEGLYDCNIWHHKEEVKMDDGYTYTDVRVGVIGIYLDGKIPNVHNMEYIGTIGVDAGLAGFFIDKPDYNGYEWYQFCEDIRCKEDAWLKEVGFFSESGYGDGGYPVYAAYDKENNVVALEIRFL